MQRCKRSAESILQAVREKDELVHIAYGTIVKELKEVSRSYKEARMALDVGKIFFDEKEIIAYSSLGIGPADLPASYSAVQDVYKGDLRE